MIWAMRVTIVGATGLVGNALLRSWNARGAEIAAATYHDHPGTDFRQLDMTDADAVRRLLADTRPEVVAVPAANPYVDYCESHPEETRRVNVDGTLNVARACRDLGARMIFFSSDYVFDGRQEAYSEGDAVAPLNEYGRQKARTESEVMAVDARNLVIRISGAYGWQWRRINFVEQVLGKLEAGQRMQVVSDIRYNPTNADNLAVVVAELAEKRAAGLFHVVGSDRLAKYEFALKVAREFGLDDALLSPVSSEAFRSVAPRPKSSTLRTDKVRAAVGAPLWGVDEGLRSMKESRAAWREYAKSLPSPV
jgi:dTDP-4-dehydrorhamnose reductase